MIIETKITLDMLTSDSVSILTQRFVGNEQLGQNHRRAFANSEIGRAEIHVYLEEPHLSAVMAVWGDKPTINTESETGEVEE